MMPPWGLCLRRAKMFLHHVDAFHHRTVLWGKLSGLVLWYRSFSVLIASGHLSPHHDHRVAFFDMQLVRSLGHVRHLLQPVLTGSCASKNQSTSGANEMIFMKSCSRSSRELARRSGYHADFCHPGSQPQHFHQNDIRTVRSAGGTLGTNDHALHDITFLDNAPGCSMFDRCDNQIANPSRFRLEPPKTLMHISSFAPELSAARRRVCG